MQLTQIRLLDREVPSQLDFLSVWILSIIFLSFSGKGGSVGTGGGSVHALM